MKFMLNNWIDSRLPSHAEIRLANSSGPVKTSTEPVHFLRATGPLLFTSKGRLDATGCNAFVVLIIFAIFAGFNAWKPSKIIS